MHALTSKITGAALAVAAFAALSLPAVAGDAYMAPAGTPDYIKKAVESPDRPADAKARDANRKPAEVLTMSGIKPGDKVVEFASFGQYYTTMISDIIGPQGKVNMYDLPYTDKFAGDPSRAFAEKHPNATYTQINYNDVELPQNVDEVFMVLYYHDLFLNDIDVAKLNKKIYDALKPGGVFLVIDHNAKAGSGTSDTKALHRIDPEVIAQQIPMAGFKLVERSNILAHPEDPHTDMVFKDNIRGITDRTVFVFRKPN